MNRSAQWIINITIMGVPFKNCLTRSGAKAGDSIYVTGSLGHSALGFEALKQKKLSKFYTSFIKTHRTAPIRTSIAKWLGERSDIHSLIDLSDGLVGDLKHILDESRIGAMIDFDQLPMTPLFKKTCSQLKKDPLSIALSGGEDYELLFTASSSLKVPATLNNIPLTKIGKILPQNEGYYLKIRNKKIDLHKFQSFEHF